MLEIISFLGGGKSSATMVFRHPLSSEMNLNSKLLSSRSIAVSLVAYLTSLSFYLIRQSFCPVFHSYCFFYLSVLPSV